MKKQEHPAKLKLAANRKTKEKAYWLDKLSGELVRSRFPYDYNQGNLRSTGKPESIFQIIDTHLDRRLSARLSEVGGGSDHTLHIILTAALAALLNKYTGNQDIIVGTPIYKNDVEREFINTVLPLRYRLDENTSFKDLLFQARRVFSEAVEHQNYPIQLLEDRLEIQDPSGSGDDFSLFDTAILLENIHDKNYLRPLNLHMTFSVSGNGRGTDALDVAVEYNSVRYRETTIQRIISHLQHLLETVLTNAGTKLSAVEILSEEERKRLLYDFNDTAADYPRSKTIHELFEEQAERTPGNIAVVDAGDESSRGLDYRELNKRADRLAHRLQNAGVRPDTIVGIMAERSVEMVVGLLAILKAGGAYLPIDPGYPRERIDYMLSDSGTDVLVTNGILVEGDKKVERWEGETVLLESSDSVDTPHTSCSMCHVSASNLAYVIYTSGTTGNPKGVLIEHKNVVRLLFNDRFQFDFNERDVWSLFHSYSFDFSVWEMYGALLYGGRLVIIPRNTALDPGEFLKVLREHKVTVLNQTPSSFYNLMHEELKQSRKSLHVRYVVFGGEALQPGKLKAWKEKYPETLLVNMFGITETTVHVTYGEIGESEIEDGISNIGKPIPTLSTYIMDTNRRLLIPGAAGELCVGGEGVARGYLNRPELTAERFVENPYKVGERLYRSGDLARLLTDGQMEHLGRKDQQVKIRGYRIELGEIESRLLNHPLVGDGIVLARLDGNGNKYLCAYYVCKRKGEEIDRTELRQYLSQELPDYMLPGYFIAIERIPLTANGKLDRKALPDPEKVIDMGGDYAAPENETQEQLVEIWSQVLGVEKEMIGIESDFFALGGHSLNATNVISRIHKELNVKVPLMELFNNPTILLLSQRIETSESRFYSAIEPVEKKEYYLLSSAQRRLHFLQQMELDNIGYNIQEGVVLEGVPDLSLLESIFRQLIERHESLRTFFDTVNNETVQRISDDVKFEIEYHEDGSADAQGSFVRAFDLSKAPLMRVGLFPLAEDKRILLTDMHHIISDGVSHAVLRDDFGILYSGGRLPGIRLQYKDYCEWQNSEKQRQIVARQKAYWLNELSGDIPVLDIPTDYPRPDVQSYEGKILEFELGRDETEALNQLGRNEESTLFMVLAAIYNVLLFKLGNQEEIVIGTPIAARRHTDLERVIGMFVNTLVMRSYPTWDKPFRTFLGELKESTLSAFEHQDYPFEELVANVVVERDLSRNPLFDVMFVLHNELQLSPQEEKAKDGLLSKSYGYRRVSSQFDLTFACFERGQQLFFNVEYGTKLFKAESIQRFINYFKTITASVLEAPGKTLSEIEVIPGDEKYRLLEAFNNTAVEYPLEKTIHELFEDQVKKTPGNIAVIDPGQGTRPTVSLTYNELNEKSDRLAYLLGMKGVKPGTIVAVMVERSSHMMVGLLGILKAGGAYLPLDPEYPEARITYILQQSNAPVLLTQKKLVEKYKSVSFEGEVIDFLDEIPHVEYGQNRGNIACAADPAYIIYTSGSTGTPKGVMVRHRNVMNFAAWITSEIPFSAGKTVLAATTISFDIFLVETLVPVTRGLTVVMGGDIEQKDPRLLAELIVTHGVDILQVTPSRLQLLVNVPEGLQSLGRISELIVCGEAFPPNLLAHVKEVFTGSIYNGYGPTEATVFAAVKDFSNSVSPDLTIGTPIANTRVYIVNPYTRVQPMGVAGELLIGGDGVAAGYLNNVELTAVKFKDSPFVPGDRLYRTGDLARWLPCGEIEFLGRMDHQVKIRGFRIELEEIEEQLLAHEEIKESVVVSKNGRDGDRFLAAYIVPKSFDAPGFPGISSLREYLAHRLPDYMIPSYFMPLEALPLTPSGKIDRKALPEPGRDRPELEKAFVEPGTELGKVIADAWKDVLNLEKVGIDDKFFELGGNSLAVVTLNNRLREILGKDIPVVAMFRHRTIRSFESYLKQEVDVGELPGDRTEALKKGEARKRRKMQMKRKEDVMSNA